MPTKQEIHEKYRAIHDALTKRYYVDKTTDKATFEAEHRQCWQDEKQELLDNGYLQEVHNYVFGATIQTVVGDFEVKVFVASPLELTPAQIANHEDKLKNANWQMLEHKADAIEA